MTTMGQGAEPSRLPQGSEVGREPRGLGAWMRATLGAIGWGKVQPRPAPPPTTDRGTQLAEERTRLAFDRSFLAAERTLMAWIRTSMAMISFGFTLVKFMGYVTAGRNLSPTGLFGHQFAPPAFGLTLVTLGTLALVVAVLQHRQTLKRLRERGLEPRWSLTLTVATVVAVLGVFAFGSLVLNY